MESRRSNPAVVLSSSGSARVKFVAVVCLFLIAALIAWQTYKMMERPKPVLPVPVATPPAEPALPITEEARPAPPLVTAKKSLKTPVRISKKTAAPKKKAPAVVATPLPKPVVPAVPPPVFVPTPAPPPPQEWQGNDTAVTHVGQIVVHNDHQWIRFWSEHHPDEAAPDVDFTRNMVIGVFAGPRPAEQFTIHILDVRTLPGQLVVDYRERLPPVGTFAVNVTVYPYDLKVIPLSTPANGSKRPRSPQR